MKTDFTHILNRLSETAAHDGWMHVCPLGEHEWKSPDGKEIILQVIDNAACELMAACYPLSEQHSLIDWEHESMSNTGSTKGAGWGKEAQVRADGLWVRVDWTPTGRAAVEGKEYRFNSPCFPRDGAVALGGNRFRVTKLSRIALTNNPNLRGQTPLTNRRDNPANPNTNMIDYKTALLSLLGLPPEAADEAINAALATAKTDKTTAIANKGRVIDLEKQLANSILDAHGIKDEGQRAMFAPLLNSTDEPTRLNATKTLAELKGKTTTTAPLHSKGGKTPGTDALLNQQTGEDDTDAAELRKFACEVADYKNSKNCSYEAANNAVRNRWQMEGKKV